MDEDEKDRRIEELENDIVGLEEDVKIEQRNATEFEKDRDAAYQALEEIKNIAKKFV